MGIAPLRSSPGDAGAASRCRRRARWRCVPGVILALALASAPGSALAVVDRDCALPGADCTLAETAARAGVHVGVALDSGASQAERDLVAREFDSVTPENAMKWGEVAPRIGQYSFGRADAIAEFAESNGLRLRGHTLVWGVMQLPEDLGGALAAASDPGATLAELVGAHFATMTGRYGGRVAQWDVVNEPLRNDGNGLEDNVFLHHLGAGYLRSAFDAARALDPGARLFLNEYALAWPSAKLEALKSLVATLRAGGAPIDGVGLQGHFYPYLPLPDRKTLEKELRDLASLGVEIELTEIDVSVWHFRGDADPLARQAEYFGDVVGACMAVPACTGVTFWGVRDDDTWLDSLFASAAPHRPLLFDASLAPKPAYFAVREAIAARAQPFAGRAEALFREIGRARRAGGIGGPSVKDARRAASRAAALLRRGRFVESCGRLARVTRALGAANGAAVADLSAATADLRTALDCDG
ncbi:MAG: Exoglucanase/xylanase [Pseudomonadota bacterium]|jgi:endo-1,4-beta-xylanase